MTSCGSISAILASTWALTGASAKNNIHFETEKDWFNPAHISKPQITVSTLVEPKGHIFKSNGTLIMHSYPRYSLNIWVPIPRGNLGTAETQLADDMRYEAARIILANRTSIGDFIMITPEDAGIAHHEMDKEPRMLRYELTLIGAHEKVSG